MLPENVKDEIEKILGGKIRFDGHFDTVFGNLKETRQEKLIDWVKGCKTGMIPPISSDKIENLLGFVFRFRDTNFRAILTKKKNEYFIALFLDKHKYYENERKKLGI